MNIEKMGSRLTAEQLTQLVTANPPRLGEGGIVYTGAVRLSFPKLAKPEAMRGAAGAVPKYQATGLYCHTNIGVLMEALRSAVRFHYPNVTDPGVMLDPMNKNSPVRNQALKVSTAEGGRDPVGKTIKGYVPGLPFVSGKSEQAVPCFHFHNGRLVRVLPEELDKALYGGCWVDIKFKTLKSGSAGNPGVFFGLQGLVKLADDNQFGGGGGATADDFAGAVAIEDPNAGAIVTGGGVAQNEWGNDAPAAAAPVSEWG